MGVDARPGPCAGAASAALRLDARAGLLGLTSGLAATEAKQQLMHLVLNNSELQGTIPASLGSLDSLVFLHLYHNKIQ